MSIFHGSSNDMLAPDLPPPLPHIERIVIGDLAPLWLAPEPLSRRRYGQAIARLIVTLAVAAAMAWALSEIAVAALLDEQRLAMIWIVA